MKLRSIRNALVVGFCLVAVVAQAQSPAPLNDVLHRAVAAQKKPFLKSLQEFVSMESGSRDLVGIHRATGLLAKKMRALGADVEFIEASDATTFRMMDTPDKLGRTVKATFRGTGHKRILLIAHMDTVYLRGMAAQQPFRIDGDKAYGLGIADDKQGVAMVVHVASLLKLINFKEYGVLTVLVNSDEELSSPGSRSALVKAGEEHDLVLSFEAARIGGDKVSLATSGIAAVELKVEGRSSHAGGAPERGVNALYELAHQVLQMRSLSREDRGLKLNWTIAHAGVNRNVIPASAVAQADVRAIRAEDYQALERSVRELAHNKLLADSKVFVHFEPRRPPMEPTEASRRLAAHAQTIYAELGRVLEVDDKPEGGGTDAAFAALKTKGAVIERMGLQGFGAHSLDNEYVLLDSIEPRLYLAVRMVMDVSRGVAP